MGKPGLAQPRSPRKRREPGELKHLSNPRKRKDSASSGERKRSSPNPDPCGRGVVGGTEAGCVLKPNALGRAAIKGESPVGAGDAARGASLSTTGHANPVGSRVAHDPRLNTLDDR
jgi:hypothetical protein